MWRLIDKKAQYVHYLIFDTPDSKNIPEIHGVRNRRCEYGIEFIIMLAHYDSIFSQHQLCWAHFLRKAAELMLRNPAVKAYQMMAVK